LHRQVKDLGDLAVGAALGDQLEDLALSLGERVIRGLLAALDAGEVVLDEQLGHARVQNGLAAVGALDGLDHFLGRRSLHDVPGCARLEHLEHVGLAVVDREREDLDVRVHLSDPPRRLEPREPGQTDVHHHHGRAQLAHALDGLFPRAGLPHHLELGIGLEDHLDALSHDLVVVHHEHPHLLIVDRHGRPAFSSASRGMSAATVVPTPIVELTVSVPPTSSARSRIPIRPTASPLRARADSAATSKPMPSSLTSRWSDVSSTVTLTRIREALECRTQLLTASWTMRKAATSTGSGSLPV